MAKEHIQALTLTANGDWHGAHQLIQNYNDELACLIHGYLHREEGDENNARYWYSQVGQSLPNNSLEQEFDRLLQMTQINGDDNF